MRATWTRFRSTFLAIAATLVWGLLYFLFQLGQLLLSQVGALRMLGTMAVFALIGGAIAAVLTLPALALRLDERGGRVWRTAFFLLAIATSFGIGLTIFYKAPAFAPLPVKGGVAIVGAALAILYARYPDEHQKFVAGALRALGLAVLTAPLLASPVVLADAAQDHPRLPEAPRPLSGEAARPDAPKRVVLVTFDGLRARSVRPFNPQARTPVFATLAGRSTWYSQCRSASDATLSSLTAILTGLPPQAVFPHVGNKTGFLRQGMLTGLAGHLAPAGYRSYFATMLIQPQHFGLQDEFMRGRHTRSIFPVGNEFNATAYLPWKQGLAWLRNKTIARNEPPPLRNQAADVVDAGVEMLKAHPDKTFLWMHLAVPHAPLRKVEFQDGKPTVLPSPAYSYEQIGRATPAQAREYDALYEDYVQYADYELGRFLAALKAAGLERETLLVVTSDHGEEFVPQRTSHGSGHLSEDVTHVPLLIHRPGQTEARRVDGWATHIDIVPTVLEEVYSRSPKNLTGLPLQQAIPADRTLVSWGLSRRYFTSVATVETVAVYQQHYKYLYDFSLGRSALYDLRQGERQDLSKVQPDVAEAMRQSLTPYMR